MKNQIVKKGNRYYNELTGKYVSKDYAKRINSYFKRNPKGNLLRASGHGFYQRKRPLFEHEKTLTKKFYGKGTQVSVTKNIKGKKIYYSPVYKSELTDLEILNIENKDYKLSHNINVELYRMSRDKERIYHIINWKVNKSFNNPTLIELWKDNAIKTYRIIEKEMKKIIKKYPIGYNKLPIIYAHVNNYFYSDLDGYSHGKSFGFLIARNDGFEILFDKFIETINWYIDKLEIMSYHNILIDRFTFYIMDFYKDNSTSEMIAKYRIGVNRSDIKE